VGFVGVVVVADPPHPIAPKFIATINTATKGRALRNAFRRLMERRITIGSRAARGALESSPGVALAERVVVLIDSATVEVPLLRTTGVPKVQAEPAGRPVQLNERA
jgi:hypothetical protein